MSAPIVSEGTYDMYHVVLFRDAVEAYLKEGKPSEWLLMPDGELKMVWKMNYRDIHYHSNAGGMFLNKISESTDASDVKIFCYKDFYIEIQPYSEGGWDYTCYFYDGSEWDGGIYDDEDAPLCLVLSELISDIDKYLARKLA